MTNWRKLLHEAAEGDKIIACTLTREELNEEFDDNYGGPKGKPFTAWSNEYVYFPATYDGAEWVARAPRNPCKKATKHVGGC